MQNTDVVVTGVPRGGTTLVCYLLNKLPNTVALSEPLIYRTLDDNPSHEAVCDIVDAFFNSQRSALLKTGSAASKQINGRVPDNPAGDRSRNVLKSIQYFFLRRRYRKTKGTNWGIGLRNIQVEEGLIQVNKALTKDFTLCIKHNPFFTALLKELRLRHPCFAIVRHPLSVLGSWNSVAFPGWEGRAPRAERLDHGLAKLLARASDRFDRQVRLLSWCFEQYEAYLPRENILKYEDLVASGGKLLSTITPRAQELEETLENRNMNQLYDRKLMRTLGEKLLQTDAAFWNLYSKDSVRSLIDN